MWNRANHLQGSMVLSVRPDVSGRVDKIILPGLPAVGDGLLHLWTSGHTRLSASGSKEQRKRKIIWKAVKAPLWHKHKRNGPCLISLNCCLGVRQSPFLRLCGSRHTFVQNPFGRWCADGQNRFYGKTCMRRKKLGRFISKSPVLLLLLHTKSSLKVTQRAEE